jgi:signal peptidase II
VHWGPHYFPAFNLADSAITVGAGMMIIDTLFLDREAPAHADQAR